MKKFFLFIIVFLSVSFPQQFRFAVWGDSQFQNPEVFEETVRRTELLKPDFVIHVGDMIHGYTYSIETARRQWKRFQKQIEPLSVPFYPTPGNHDVTTKQIQPAYLEAWGRNKLYYSFDYENSHFIILNTGLDQNFDSIPPVEMNWLKKDLERSKNKKNIFISMHSPLHLNSDYNWKPVHDLLRKYPVKAVFTGHYHFYDFREIDGIEYYCLNSSGNMGVYNEAAGSSHHFLWITVDGNNINTTVVTKTNMYPHDYMLGMKSQISPLMLEKDATIVIADPSAGIDTTVTLILTNNSDMNKKFIIRPLTNDYRWKFPWNGYSVNVNPGSKEELDMKIIFEGGKTEPGDLPSVEIKTKYYLQENKVSEHEYHLYLFSPPVITASYNNDKITPDGLDNESAWLSTDSINELYTDRLNNPAEQKTIVKVLYDNENLYVHVKGEEPEPEGLISAAYGDIPLVFGDDDFEIYFDTNRDLRTFFRLMVNPAGTVLCSSPKGLFSFNFDVKTYVGDNNWSAEFRIPLKELGIQIDIRGNIWGFNVRRHRQQSEIPQSDWSKMNTYPPYQPEYFGLLKFR